MNDKPKILHLEDNESDIALVRMMLERGGMECDFTCVATGAEFAEALERGGFDLIFSDFTLPDFDGITALNMTRARYPDLPFIFVTGTMGDETAVTAMKNGATDYVLKSNLSRLKLVVERALREAGESRARRNAEEAENRERQMLEDVAANIGAGLAVISQDYKIIWINSIINEIYGDVTGDICYRSFKNSTEICSGCGVREVFEKGKERVVCEQPGIDVNGDPDWSEITITPVRDKDGNIVAALEMVTSITERKRTEEEQRRSGEMLRTVIQASPLAIVMLDPAGMVTLWNRSAEKIFGWSREEAMDGPLPTIPEEQRNHFSEIFEQLLDGHLLDNFETLSMKKDGSLIDISISAAPVHDAQGKVSAAVALISDVTERKKVERKLAESEQLFRTAFENSALGMVLTGIDGRFLRMNESLCAMFGYAREELNAMNFPDLVHPDDAAKSIKWNEAMLAGEPCPSSMEKRCVRKDRRVVLCTVCKSLIRDGSGKPLYFISQVQDITEQRSLEHQLHHAQKMEAVGTLTGGIAHDFNNILTAIMGHANFLEMKLAKDNPLYQNVEQILGASERAADLTRSLLAFSRKQAIESKPTDLNGIVRGIEKLMTRLLREDIELRRTSTVNDLIVLVDAGQIEQVLMNLVVNACDAMPDGGSLAVNTSEVEIDREFVMTHGYGEPGGYALLTVTDTGCGMTEETQQRIFEPFYTTKEVGKGTGLGLAIVYNIVKQHGGYINCYSEPGTGTTFRIYLPLAAKAEDQERQQVVAPLAGGTETILVAEDDPQVRELNRGLLNYFGYRVIEAENGQEAVARFIENRDEIRVVILDVIMPKMNGRDAYAEMARIKPGIKVIYTSGYTADILRQSEITGEKIYFLGKPAAPRELLSMVRKVLDDNK